jgi:hypothetical protein
LTFHAADAALACGADRDYLKAVQQPFVFSPFAVR